MKQKNIVNSGKQIQRNTQILKKKNHTTVAIFSDCFVYNAVKIVSINLKKRVIFKIVHYNTNQDFKTIQKISLQKLQIF